MNRILVSIIIPVFNGEKFISHCLDKLKNQTYKDIEIVIVNDGSTDKTQEILDKYDFENLKHKIIKKKNTGVSDSRNEGIRRATGDYIVFLDVDDELTNDAISNYVNIVKEKKTDIVRGNYVLKYGTAIVNSKEKLEEGSYDREEIEKLRRDLYLDRFKGFGCLYFIKRNILIENEIYFPQNMSFMEDFIFISKLLKYSSSIYLTDIITYIYNQNSASASHTADIQKRIKNIDIRYQNAKEFIEEEKLDLITKREIIDSIITIYLKTIYYVIENYKLDKSYDTSTYKRILLDKVTLILKDNDVNIRELSLINKLLLKCIKIKNDNITIFISNIYTKMKGK